MKRYRWNTIAILGAILGAGTLACSGNGAGSSGNLVRGPILAGRSGANATITWETESRGEARIEYGPTEEYGSEAWGLVEQVELGEENYYINTVSIGGLEPSTWTHYRITSLIEPSPDFAFRAAPDAAASFRFVVYGDTGPDTPVVFFDSWDDIENVHPEILTSIVRLNPDFIVNTGDIVADGYDPGEWEYLFHLLGDIPRTVSYYPTAGRDDRGGEELVAAFFGVPSTLSYSFDYGNSHFTFVNSNLDFSEGSTQYQWLEGDLAAAAERDNIQHMFVFMHTPAYCSAMPYMEEAEVVEAREILAPLFSSYGVKVVFQGYVHLFEITEEIDGVTYVVTGGGGGTISSLNQRGNEPWTRWTEVLFNFVEVIVSPNYVALNARKADGSLFVQTVVN